MKNLVVSRIKQLILEVNSPKTKLSKKARESKLDAIVHNVNILKQGEVWCETCEKTYGKILHGMDLTKRLYK